MSRYILFTDLDGCLLDSDTYSFEEARPVLDQKPDGSYDPDIELPGLIRAPGIGPVGWNHAVLALLNQAV